ncbi:NAD-dependent succinate-semialdehyde dehydrogenase [Cupriavidus basilensis]|uniref:NAD-dependent succinate-semialdehyde dehydrogenase n=1 Tax=Cupriavidus basilensis TaxID=68895 RepID=A0ABT6ANZ8_9BURK|nr:NAD-dependent succinate-semialdehyde dehydrogenase [Cupriavidus basilensis]MDF3834344.1 NAD-dependent succinate-semialdehyde dehydrogenase [Cupriavidus basilensis]
MTYPDTQLLVGGEWCDAVEGRTLPVLNPATGQTIGRVAHAGIIDLDRALDASLRGFETWRYTPAIERSHALRRAAQLMRERTETIAHMLTLEQGKPLSEAMAETRMSADVIEWFAEEARRVYGRVVPARSLAVQQLVLREPVGPVAAFTPWNFPINQTVRKVAAALATGCSIIVKAPEETPAAPAALVRAFVDAGIPAGVISLVFGDPAQISRHLIPHPAVRKVTFTGSTPVGKQLAALAGAHMKRVTMELGGHAPVIVAEDADIGLAVRASASAKFRNAGQICIAPTRFLVHDSVHDEFVCELVRHAQSLKLGNGMGEGTTLGPLANERRLAAMEAFTADAVQRGAHLATGGDRIGGQGNFFAPTVLTDVPLTARVLNDEPFGPMAAVRRFQTLDEAIAEANRLPYGLAGYAFTRSLKNAHRLIQRLELGLLWINQPALAWPELPFGGVKDSGFGSEGGPEALEAYTTTKSVSLLCD